MRRAITISAYPTSFQFRKPRGRVLSEEHQFSDMLYQYSLLGKQMGRVINLLNSPVIGKKGFFHLFHY